MHIHSSAPQCSQALNSRRSARSWTLLSPLWPMFSTTLNPDKLATEAHSRVMNDTAFNWSASQVEKCHLPHAMRRPVDDHSQRRYLVLSPPLITSEDFRLFLLWITSKTSLGKAPPSPMPSEKPQMSQQKIDSYSLIGTLNHSLTPFEGCFL